VGSAEPELLQHFALTAFLPVGANAPFWTLCPRNPLIECGMPGGWSLMVQD
jgi:hypothetical protein